MVKTSRPPLNLSLNAELGLEILTHEHVTKFKNGVITVWAVLWL